MATVSGTVSNWSGGLGTIYTQDWMYFGSIQFDGTFSIADVANGEYDFYADDGGAGGSFDPAYQHVVVSGSDVTGVDYAYTPPTYAIRGLVRMPPWGAIANAKLAWTPSGGSTVYAYSGEDGTFEFTGLADYTSGSLDIVDNFPTNYVFGPAARDISIFGADVENQDFVGANKYSGAGWLVLGGEYWWADGLYTWDDEDGRYEHYFAGGGLTTVLEGGESPRIWRTDTSGTLYTGTVGDLPCNPWTRGSPPPEVYESFPDLPPPTTQAFAATWNSPNLVLEGGLQQQKLVDFAATWQPDFTFQGVLGRGVGLSAGWQVEPQWQGQVGFELALGAEWGVAAPDWQAALAGGPSYILYRLPWPIAATPGGLLECRLRVTSSLSDVDTGLLVGFRDGATAYGVYVRADGLNAAGGNNVACDNTAWLRLRISARGGSLRVLRAGDLLGEWPGVAEAGASGLYLGIVGAIHAEIDWLRYATRLED